MVILHRTLCPSQALALVITVMIDHGEGQPWWGVVVVPDLVVEAQV